MSKHSPRRARPSRDDEATSVGHRHERLQQLLHEELDAVLQDEVSDPSLDGARVVSVELSPDYGIARVCVAVSLSSSSDRLLVERAFARVTGFLRARIGDALDLKRTPELRLVLVDGEATSS
jgi:ribosome-binding factor A